MIKTVEEAARNYAYKSLRAFLEERQDLKWLLGVIRSSGIERTTLVEIFGNLRGHGNRQCYEKAAHACRQEGLLP